MKHLTTQQAAQELGISPHTLDAWRAKGFGPQYRKIGRRVFYEKSDLSEWAQGQARWSTTADAPAGAATNPVADASC